LIAIHVKHVRRDMLDMLYHVVVTHGDVSVKINLLKVTRWMTRLVCLVTGHPEVGILQHASKPLFA
jgi:hypothetical protein